ncbi:MAG: glycine betaine ABC transporter substrate-binding protein [Proteocatella sp.]
MRGIFDSEDIRKINLMVPFLVILVMFMAFFTPRGVDNYVNTIKIATKPMTEQYILGEMLSILIEEKSNLKVELTKGVGGGTATIHPAMLNGEYDMYFEYTGTSWLYILKSNPTTDDALIYRQLQKIYPESFALAWSNLFGFNNSYGLAISQETATYYNITTYSDLAKISDKLTFGAEADFFQREDGFSKLTTFYNMNFKDTVELKITEKYDALNKNSVDVINIFTTDGRLSNSKIKVLVDDQKFYHTYFCGTIVSTNTLEDHPELSEIISLLDGVITDEDMSKMNYLVENEKRTDRDVAREFLESKNLI